MKLTESASGIPRKDFITGCAGVLPIKVISFPFAHEARSIINKSEGIVFIYFWFMQTSRKPTTAENYLHLVCYFLDEEAL
jgi:hypothetical protein